MAYNLYGSLFTFGLAAALPTSVDNPNMPRFYYATDTNALYVWNPSHTGGAAWELQFQLKPVAFAALPVTGRITGSEAFVSDATAPTKGGVIAGAGAVLTGAVWDGAAWRGV